MIQQRKSSVEKYRELANSIKPLRRRKATIEIVAGHINWLIDNTNWNDTSSVDLTIGKIKALGEGVSIKRISIDKILDKLKSIGDTEIINSILSKDSQAWLKKYLK